jgi:hypothetical protein
MKLGGKQLKKKNEKTSHAAGRKPVVAHVSFTQNQGTAAIVSDLFSSSSDDVTAANVGKAICQPERAIYGWSAD